MSTGELLTVTVTGEDPVVVNAKGQIDSHSVAELDATLSSLGPETKVAVELSEVDFVDSSGLRALVKAHKRHVEGGGALTIVKPSQPVMRLLDITGLASELEITN